MGKGDDGRGNRGAMTAAVCAQTLPAGAILRDWRIEGVSSVTGDAILYNARQPETGEDVFIQEYFPPGIGLRLPDGSVVPRTGEAAEQFLSGRETFLMQGAALAGLCVARPVPNLPRVRSVFMQQGTAYMVMDRYGGAPLQTELSLGYRLPEDRLIALFRPLALALGQLHDAGVCHLHICPAVIMRQNKRLLLTGFAGAAAPRGWEEGDGIAFRPIELLVPVAEPGPWSDVYALAAVIYACMTGTPPPEAVSRLGPVDFPPDCAGDYSAALREAVAQALACVPAERPQGMKAWCAAWPKARAAREPDREAAGAGWGATSPFSLPVKGAGAKTGVVPFVPPPSASVEDAGQRMEERSRIRVVLASSAAAAGGALLALWLAGGLFPVTGDDAAGQMRAGEFVRGPLAGAEQSAPLMLLEQEVAAARDAARQIGGQVQEAEALKWPAERVQALRRAAERAATAVTELEALHAAPDPSARRRPETKSFAAVLEQQRLTVRAALQEAWRISAAGYAAAADRSLANGDANFHALEKLLAGDDRAEPTLLMGNAATAHALLGTAYDRLQRAAKAVAPSDPITASRQLAETASAYEDVRAQSAFIRDALRSSREHAAAREAEMRAVERERRQFRSALASARRAVSELGQVMRTAGGHGGEALPRPLKRDAALRLEEAKRRLAGLEQIVLDTPDMRGERLQAALVEVRETEKTVRALLAEARGRLAAAGRAAQSPDVERLVRRADSRLARNSRRYDEFQKLLAQQGGVIAAKGGDPLGQREAGEVYRELMAQADIRERLARAETADEAEALYQQFASQHAKVDRHLDQVLRAAARAARP